MVLSTGKETKKDQGNGESGRLGTRDWPDKKKDVTIKSE